MQNNSQSLSPMRIGTMRRVWALQSWHGSWVAIKRSSPTR